MSALSTPGGGGNTAQSKPTAGKSKYQKLDINSLYCANRGENSEPSLVKSQLSRKHGMQSLGKVPSARRPPANLPSLKTETGLDANPNSISTTATTTTSTTTTTCTPQATVTPSASVTAAGGAGWGALPPPSSNHFRNEFPSLEAAAQPTHRDHAPPHTQLRPHTEGSWTSGGSTRAAEATGGSAPAQSAQTPALRTILPPFLMKGSGGVGGGLGGFANIRETRSPPQRGPGGPGRAQAGPRASEVLASRPILREEQISSLDEISRDAGWAMQDDIDYDQKLDFSDGESSGSATNRRIKNHGNTDQDRMEKPEAGDEEQIWAARRRKQNNEVAAAVARGRQRKEEEQRRQREQQTGPGPYNKEDRDNRNDRPDTRERQDIRERQDFREKQDIRDRPDNRDRIDPREKGDSRERLDNRDRLDNREKDRTDNRERVESREKERNDNRGRERDHNDNREKDRSHNNDHDYRDYNRGSGNNNDGPPFPKTFQSTIPPRFLKQQQNRQHEDQKGWAFPSGKSGAPSGRRPDQSQFNQPARHNARRSYPRDYSDREDDYRREKEGGPQWRSEMQDYERSGREYDRQSSKESYKDYDRRSDSDRKSVESNQDARTSAGEKLSEVFDRKIVSADTAVEQNTSSVEQLSSTGPPVKNESVEKFVGSWAESEDHSVPCKQAEKNVVPKQDDLISKPKETRNEAEEMKNPPSQLQANSQNIPPTQGYNMAPHFAQSQTYSQQVQLQPTMQQQPTPQSNQQSVPSVSQVQLKTQLSQPSYSTTTVASAAPQPHVNQTQFQQAFQPEHRHSPPSQAVNRPTFSNQKTEKTADAEIPSKSIIDGANSSVLNNENKQPVESSLIDIQKKQNIQIDNKGSEGSKVSEPKDLIERKNSGSSSSDKKARYTNYPAVFVRAWGSRESRGRRSHRTSRSDNKASESDGSPDAAQHNERKERRRAPRSPRAPKKTEDNTPRPIPSIMQPIESTENREAFAPRGQPSRRGRGGFQGTSRPPAPAKRVTGYGPPNTKSPFSQASQVRPNEEGKDQSHNDDKSKGKFRTGSSTARPENRGRDRRHRGQGHISGEDENWETTSEHSDSGAPRKLRSQSGGQPKSGGDRRGPQGGRSVRSNQRNGQPKKDITSSEISECLSDLKISQGKKDEEVADDGFQEVRNKKNSKDSRVPSKEEPKQQIKSQSNQPSGRNNSSSRNSGDKAAAFARGSAQAIPGKSAPQFDRPKHPNIAPRFMKQRQNKFGLSAFGPDTSVAPPPPAVNAWDKPIAQTLRGNVEEPAETPDKSSQSSQRSTPCAVPTEAKPVPAACSVEKASVLDGTTPPVETIIFENTNYKTAPPATEAALKQKFAPQTASVKPEEVREIDSRSLAFNGEVRLPPRSIQELIAENGRPNATDPAIGLPMSFEEATKREDSSDMKLDFSAFDSDLGHLTEEKTSKSLSLQRTHMGVSTISPSTADLNLKIQSVKKVWEMPAVAEGAAEELVQFAGGVSFEETSVEGGAPPNVCKVKPTQQLQSPPPQHYNHMGYAGGYGGLSVPSPPAVLFNSSQPLLGSSQQLPQQGGLYGAFLDQSRGQFGGFPGAPYGAGSGPYNYQPPPDMFQNLPNQYRLGHGGGAAFGQSGQLANSPSTVLISSSSNSLMSTTVKPSNQQIGAIGQYTNTNKATGVGGVGGVGSAYQAAAAAAQQYLGYSGPVGDQYLGGLLPRPAPPANSYYSPYQPPPAPAPPSYPMQFTQPAQSAGFSSQYLSSQLQVAAAVQQMQQQQYRAPLQQAYGAPAPRHPPGKSPLDHANGFAGGAPGGASPTPKVKPPSHSPPHKYHQPPPTHHHQMAQQVQSNRCGVGLNRPPPQTAPRYPAPIQRPHAPAYRPAPPQQPAHRYYAPAHHHSQPRGGGGGGCAERGEESGGAAAERAAAGEEGAAPGAGAGPASDPPPADSKTD